MSNPVSPNGPWYDRRLWQITPVRDAFWIAMIVGAVVLGLWLGYELRAIFTPVLIALALAYLFDPIITTAERRWNVPRPATISAILGAVLVLVTVLALWLGPTLIGQVRGFAESAPDLIERLLDEADVHLEEERLAPLRETFEEMQRDPLAYLGDRAAAVAGQAMGFLGTLIGRMTLLLIMAALVPVYFFFFAWQFGPLTHYFRQYIPLSHRDRTLQIIGRMNRIVATYFRARVVIALIMGAMFSIGWAIVGVPYWLLLGMGSGLLSLIPYASIVGWPLAVLLKWGAVTGPEDAGFAFWSVVFWPSAVYLIVQAIESWVLTPWIQGRSLDMSVVTILIVIFVGGALGGLYGLILAIPVAACIKILFVELVLPRIHQWAAEN